MTLTLPFMTWLIEDGCAVLGFADHPSDPKHYLLLQRTLEPSDQDREEGMDQTYIEIDSQIRSEYGPIENARLERRRLLLQPSVELAAEVSNGEAIEVQFDLTSSEVSELADHLSILIGEQNVQRTDAT